MATSTHFLGKVGKMGSVYCIHHLKKILCPNDHKQMKTTTKNATKEFTSSVKEGGLFSKQMNHGLKRNKAQSAHAESTHKGVN